MGRATLFRARELSRFIYRRDKNPIKSGGWIQLSAALWEGNHRYFLSGNGRPSTQNIPHFCLGYQSCLSHVDTYLPVEVSSNFVTPRVSIWTSRLIFSARVIHRLLYSLLEDIVSIIYTKALLLAIIPAYTTIFLINMYFN